MPSLPRIQIAPDGRQFIAADGENFEPFGVNYYRPHTGWAPQVWRTFDAGTTARDFDLLAEHGVNCVRMFLSFGSFYMEQERLIDDGLRKFDQFVDLAEDRGIYVHPTGPDHWEGWPAWMPRDRYADERALAAQERFWELFIPRYKGRTAIFAYDLQNEPFVRWDTRAMRLRWNAFVAGKYGTAAAAAKAWNRPADFSLDAVPIPSTDPKPLDPMLLDFQQCREQVADEWTRRQAQVIRSIDPQALITVGLIQWTVPSYIHSLDGYAAFVPQQQAKYLDFMEVHFYPLDNGGYEYEDAEREQRNLAYLEGICRECSIPGKPLVLAEFGWYGGGQIPRRDHISRFATDTQQAELCGKMIDSTAGLCCGWLNWGIWDHPEAKDCSLFTGLFTVDGKPKAWAGKFRELARKYCGKPIPPLKLGTRPALDWPLSTTDPTAGNRFRDAYYEAVRADPGAV